MHFGKAHTYNIVAILILRYLIKYIMLICKCYLHAKLSDERGLQSDGFEESIDGNTWNNFGSPLVNPTYIEVCQCREQSGLLNTSHLCHIVLIILWASLWALQVIKQSKSNLVSPCSLLCWVHFVQFNPVSSRCEMDTVSCENTPPWMHITQENPQQPVRNTSPLPSHSSFLPLWNSDWANIFSFLTFRCVSNRVSNQYGSG